MSMVVNILSAKAHFAAQCPFRNLLIKKTDDDIETVVHKLTGSATDSGDNIRVASIQLSVRCSYTAVSNED